MSDAARKIGRLAMRFGRIASAKEIGRETNRWNFTSRGSSTVPAIIRLGAMR